MKNYTPFLLYGSILLVLIVSGCTDSSITGNSNEGSNQINDEKISNEQVLSWNKTFGGTGNDFGQSVQQTSDKGYVVLGNTYSFGAGNRDFWLIKTNWNGSEQWSKTFGGVEDEFGRFVQQTSDKGYILVGDTKSFGSDKGDIWLIKTDKNGKEQWSKTFDNLGYDCGHSVIQTSDGGYILVGETSPFVNKGYVWLIKTDKNGKEQWSKTFDDNLGIGRSVRQTSDGGYIIGGHTGSFGSGPHSLLLIKTDKNGKEQWSKTFGGSSDVGYSAQQTSDGGYVITGRRSPLDIDNLLVWLIKTDSDGSEQWNKTFGYSGYNSGYSVQQTSDGGYVIASHTSTGAGKGDVWLIKTDAYGN